MSVMNQATSRPLKDGIAPRADNGLEGDVELAAVVSAASVFPSIVVDGAVT